MICRNLRPLLGAAATLSLFVAMPATAATIVQNFTGTNGSVFALQQFNPALGSLQSVSVAFDAFLHRVVANPSPQAGIASFDLRGYADMTSADAGAPVLPWWEQTVLNDIQDRFNGEYDLFVSGPIQTTTLISSLSNYIGSSSFNYTLNGGVDILGSNVPYGATSRNAVNAIASVTYTYSQIAAVPEPDTWAMMIVGFGVIGGTVRARKGAPKPTKKLATWRQ